MPRHHNECLPLIVCGLRIPHLVGGYHDRVILWHGFAIHTHDSGPTARAMIAKLMGIFHDLLLNRLSNESALLHCKPVIRLISLAWVAAHPAGTHFWLFLEPGHDPRISPASTCQIVIMLVA